MLPTALTTDEQAMVTQGVTVIAGLGLAAVGLAVAGLGFLGLKAIYASVATAIKSRGNRIG